MDVVEDVLEHDSGDALDEVDKAGWGMEFRVSRFEGSGKGGRGVGIVGTVAVENPVATDA